MSGFPRRLMPKVYAVYEYTTKTVYIPNGGSTVW